MKMTMTAALAAGALMLMAGSAQAQDASENAISGDYSLSSGFSPDPYSISVTAGGSIDASQLGGTCSGYISTAPDIQLTYSSGSLPLYFYVESAADTTLVVNGPDGLWYCDDDSNGDLNPRVTYTRPRSGVYDVWIGAFDGGTQSATLNITELTDNVTGGGGGDGGVIDTSLPATFGDINLSSGFTPDPYRINLTAGGSIAASSVSSECLGSVAAAPDVQLTYSADSLPLIIRTEADGDTTLMVNGPGGEWYCDDDSGGGDGNAQVRLSRPASGVYDIYVGVYGGGAQPAQLLISERN